MNRIKQTFLGVFFVFSYFQNAYSANFLQLKKVSISDSQRVDLFFDRKVDLAQVKTEVHKELLQITLNGSIVHPAKITTSSGPYITKVFSYQYAPQVVRTRISFKDKIDSLDKKFDTVVQGNSLSIRFKFKTQGTQQSVETISQVQVQPEKKDEVPDLKKEQLLKKIEASDIQKENPKREEKLPEIQPKKELAQVASKPEVKSWKSKWLKLYGVLALMLFIGCFFLVGAKQIKNGKGKKITALLGKFPLLGKSSSLLGMISRKGPVIDVLANQYIGPKKQITVIKVAGRTLVLGVSAENINLISEFEDEEQEIDNPVNSNFSSVAKSSQSSRVYIEPQFSAQRGVSKKTVSVTPSVLNQIRNKVKEMGPLG